MDSVSMINNRADLVFASVNDVGRSDAAALSAPKSEGVVVTASSAQTFVASVPDIDRADPVVVNRTAVLLGIDSETLIARLSNEDAETNIKTMIAILQARLNTVQATNEARLAPVVKLADFILKHGDLIDDLRKALGECADKGRSALCYNPVFREAVKAFVALGAELTGVYMAEHSTDVESSVKDLAEAIFNPGKAAETISLIGSKLRNSYGGFRQEKDPDGKAEFLVQALSLVVANNATASKSNANHYSSDSGRVLEWIDDATKKLTTSKGKESAYEKLARETMTAFLSIGFIRERLYGTEFAKMNAESQKRLKLALAARICGGDGAEDLEKEMRLIKDALAFLIKLVKQIGEANDGFEKRDEMDNGGMVV